MSMVLGNVSDTIVLEDNDHEKMVDVGNDEVVKMEDTGNDEAIDMVVRAPKPDCPTMPLEVNDPHGYHRSKCLQACRC